MEIRRAERKKAKLRLGIAAPSGAGKTYGALLLAFGLGGKIGLIDTEHGSGDLYCDLGEYDIISISAPYTVAKYREAMKMFEQAGYSTIIIDSLSHAWAGDGGLLDKQGKAADKSGNSWQAWRQVTPEHNALVDAMLQSPCHIIATMRAKTEYVQEKDDRTGKSVVRKLGMAPVMRDGIEFEFSVFFDLSMEHIASTSKDRTRLFDGQYFKITQETGKTLLAWLETGAEPAAQAQDVLPNEEIEKHIAATEKKISACKTYKELTSLWHEATAGLDDATKAALSDKFKERRAALEEMAGAP
jgi:hypothetical protein